VHPTACRRSRRGGWRTRCAGCSRSGASPEGGSRGARSLVRARRAHQACPARRVRHPPHHDPHTTQRAHAEGCVGSRDENRSAFGLACA
jgi:hypothetical protein